MYNVSSLVYLLTDTSKIRNGITPPLIPERVLAIRCVENIAHDARDDADEEKGESGGMVRPAEVLEAVGVHVGPPDQGRVHWETVVRHDGG